MLPNKYYRLAVIAFALLVPGLAPAQWKKKETGIAYPTNTAPLPGDAIAFWKSSTDTTTNLYWSTIQGSFLPRSNHTGTQLLSTISDAGSLAALNAAPAGTLTGSDLPANVVTGRLNAITPIGGTATVTGNLTVTGALQGTPADTSIERSIKTEAALRSTLSTAGELMLTLRADITLTSPLTVPVDKTITFGSYKLIKGATATILFQGELVATRRQIFSGFASGEVVGPFGGAGIAMPEWWGLTALHHDVAINNAIQSSPYLRSTGQNGVVVDLGSRTYDVSTPLDLTGSRCQLAGKGSIATKINATSLWAPTAWEIANVTGWATVAGGNHSSMIWIGSGPPGSGLYSSYHTGVTGVYINGFAAANAHRTRYVSGISSRGGVEEISVIDRILIEGFSGCGIGFPGHNGNSSIVNGLHCTNFWIANNCKAESHAIYTSQWTYNAKFSVGTIDIRLDRTLSAGALVTPSWVLNYADYAVIAGGKAEFNQLHIEGAVVGIFVRVNNAWNNVTITAIDCNHMMDRARSAIYWDDGLSGADAVPGNTNWFGYSAAVVIGAASTPTNLSDKVTLINVSCVGQMAYLLRDDVTSKHISTFGKGQVPTVSAGSAIAFYSRGNTWSNGGYPSYGSPTANVVTNFIGPIF